MTIKVKKTENNRYEGETENDKIALRVVTGETYPTREEIEQAQLPDVQIKVKETKP